MGWKQGYTILESQVVNLYDKGLLTKEILYTLVIPFKGTNCDIGGSQDLISKDKLSFPQIVCKTLYPKEYEDAMKNPKWHPNESPEELGEYHIFSNSKFNNIWYKIWKDEWQMW